MSELSGTIENAWQELSRENMTGAIQLADSVIATQKSNRSSFPRGFLAEAWRIKAWAHFTTGDIRSEVDALANCMLAT
jgi:hypothetical protein